MAFMFHEIRNPLHAIVLCTEYLLETFASNLIPPVQEEVRIWKFSVVDIDVASSF